ncbi:heterokaryon incompatibility protein-domain-containing protein [Rhexocercosporidium sp. MPI-PUGE-AT-0058]|nr:heterokaryon incompatibility protein-domain-containing protein [Rhexocercosporidium sp. MPI-PUGE-AT-0058]
MGDFTKIPRPFYPSLSSENREIRLLHLQPRVTAENLQCRLSVASLDSNPYYEALSYRWGTGTGTVLVDSHDVLIPSNLEDALLKMRLDDKERILWADAICIDQSCVAERNSQVALMADIYKKCDKCLIWLGKTGEFDRSTGLEEWSGNLLELLSALSKKHHLDKPDAPRINPMFGFTNGSLILLNSVEWWSRIWVVQEVLLSPRSTVLFGSFEMLFSDIVKAMEFINEHDIGSSWDPENHHTDELCHCMDRMKVTFLWAGLLELRDHTYGLLQAARYQPEMSNKDPAAGSNSPDIVDILLNVRHRDATDARDKVFGILSLVEDWRGWKPIEADYSKDASQVFTEFGTQMIQSEYGAKTLLLARGINHPSPGLIGLPTWVPDWASKGTAYEHYLITAEKSMALVESPPLAAMVGSTLVLYSALSIGKIIKLSSTGALLHRSYGQPPSMENYQRYTQMIDDWRMFVAKDEDAAPGTDPYNLSAEPGDWAESGSYTRLMEDLERSQYTVDFMPQILAHLAMIRERQGLLRRMYTDEMRFYRTIIHDTYPLHLRKHQYQQEALCILRILIMFYETYADPDRFLTRVNSVVLTKMAETLDMVHLEQKRLMRTADGSLGIGPKDMDIGDEIFLFKGVQRPFVLRASGARAVDGKEVQPVYELVGHCYVDDLERKDLDWETGKQIFVK